MVRPVFKTAMEAPSAAPVGSIPTRSRHLLSSSGCSPHPDPVARRLRPQDTAPGRPASPPPRRDPRHAPPQLISPLNAFWRSFLIPGWGQARLNRKLTGGMFVAWEGVTLGMTLKTRQELALSPPDQLGTGRRKAAGARGLARAPGLQPSLRRAGGLRVGAPGRFSGRSPSPGCSRRVRRRRQYLPFRVR